MSETCYTVNQNSFMKSVAIFSPPPPYLGVECEPVLVYASLAEDEGQELVEGDVLHHGGDDVSGLL